MCQICVPGNVNTRLPRQSEKFGAPNRKWFMPRFADDGTANGIDYSAGKVTLAAMEALINNPDPSKRLYPMPVMESITGERDDTIKETPDSGRAYNVRKGNKNVSGEVFEVDHSFYAQIVGLECFKDLMEYTIDECGHVRGGDSLVGSQKLAGAIIQRDTFDVKLVDATQTTVTKVMLSYQIDTGFRDDNYAMLLQSDFESDANPLDLEGLLSVDGSDLSASAASQEVIASLFYPYSGVRVNEPATNFTASFFELDGGSGGDGAVPDTAVENPDGTYTLTFPLATFSLSDNLVLKVVENGYNSDALEANVIVAGA